MEFFYSFYFPFFLPSRYQECQKVTERAISVDTAFELWISATRLGEDAISEKSRNFVFRNGNQVFVNTDVRNVPENILLDVISSEEIFAKESEIFSFVNRWISAHSPEKKTISELISHIRFPLMTPGELTAIVRPVSYVTAEVRVEAFEFNQHPELFGESSELRFKRRKLAVPNRITWSPEKSKNDVIISENLISFSSQGIAMADLELIEGIHYEWNFEIVQNGFNGAAYTSFGVAEKEINVNAWTEKFGRHGWGWGWGKGALGENYLFSHNDQTWNHEKSDLKPGTIINVQLTRDRSLIFAVDGKIIGQHPLKPTGKFFPAVGTDNYRGVKVKITFNSKK